MNPTDQAPIGSELIVDLWAARLPGWVGFAEHCWIVIWRGGIADRWEVWQEPDCLGRFDVADVAGGESWGHLHRNLWGPTAGIRDNPAYWIRRWEGGAAETIALRTEVAPDEYPWRDCYRYVPGPNSNTFIQWCLGDEHQLGWRSVGRGFARWDRRPQVGGAG